jgi:hypothetical protein
MGPKVSGRKTIMMKVTPQSMRAIQKVQRQPILEEQKPETIGANSGPNTVV